MKPPNRRKSTANHVKAERKSVKNSDTNHKTPTSDGPKFTIEEYNQLMAMLQKNNDGNPQHYANTTCIIIPLSPMTHVAPHSKLYWIINSGATDHVTSSVELTNLQLLPKSATIQLLDGGQTHIKSISSLQVTPHIKVDEVLKVPQFQVNLLSVSKLTHALQCIVIFFSLFLCCAGHYYGEDDWPGQAT